MSSNTDNRLSPASPAEAGAFVSVHLAAKAAGITWQAMQQLAVAFAKGRTDPWLGAVLDVRTEKVLGRKIREIRVATLPAAVRAALDGNAFRFLLAAEQAERGAELTPPDFMLLHRAAQADFGVPGFVETVVAEMCTCAGSSLLDVPRAVYELAVDNLYGYGFRDDALPGVSADYRDWLDAYRRHLGMSARYYAALLMELAGVDRPERLDGKGFILVAKHLMGHGVPWALPPRTFMDREAVGILHEARRQLGLSYDEFMRIVTTIGGGVHSVADLDPAGWCRVRAFCMKLGFRRPPPAPRVNGAPGFITQAQANLLWRLWSEQSGQRGEAGALATLTAAGAARLIDELLEPVIGRRLAEAQPQA